MKVLWRRLVLTRDNLVCPSSLQMLARAVVRVEDLLAVLCVG